MCACVCIYAFGLRLHTAGRCSARRWIVSTIESRLPLSLFLPTSELMKTPAKSLLHTARSLQPLQQTSKAITAGVLTKSILTPNMDGKKKKAQSAIILGRVRPSGRECSSTSCSRFYICFVFFINQIGLSELWSQLGSVKLDAAQTRTLCAGEPWQSVRRPRVAPPPLPNTDLSNMDADLQTSHARCTSQ